MFKLTQNAIRTIIIKISETLIGHSDSVYLVYSKYLPLTQKLFVVLKDIRMWGISYNLKEEKSYLRARNHCVTTESAGYGVPNRTHLNRTVEYSFSNIFKWFDTKLLILIQTKHFFSLLFRIEYNYN